MTAFTARFTLRAAVLTAVAAGAVLVPSAAAFADSSPKPSEPAVVDLSEREAADDASKDADRPAVTPRGGVAAGERPAGSGDNSTAVLAGSVAGAALLAGAGTIVLRRRSAAGHNG
ncbi:hypothetical protein [Streptomyces sp. SM11]|uniref:hypothetical protein n=1 Tax=Streptomyces sp. SM11 TaxID=565557 RepID=UPI000CD50B83|nr:hypothetical protein [Streptomyces sp. SM11]